MFASVGLLIPPTAALSPCVGTASLYVLFVVTQFPDHVKVKDTSQLINGTSSVLQKLVKY